MAHRGKTRYIQTWEQDFPWLQPHKSDPYSAWCKVCRKSIDVKSMGKQAVKSHNEGKKHQSSLLSTKNCPSLHSHFSSVNMQSATIQESAPKKSDLFVKEHLPPSQASSTSNAVISTSSNIVSHVPSTSKPDSSANYTAKSGKIPASYVVKDEVTKAETLWCLQTVLTHKSLRATEEDCLVMKKMFPQSEIAQGMKMSKDKVKYTLTYGLGPFFSSILLDKTKTLNHFVIGFDESLNKCAQKEQMDVVIRYWDLKENSVKSRYLTSIFLNRTTANDLYKGLIKALRDYDLSKILQISMDGPRVNFKLLNLLKQNLRSGEDDPKFLEIGSCGIHVMHGAFKAGVEKTGWELQKVLRALYNFFKDAPSRRGDFTLVTKCTQFPLKFCGIRWLENVPVVKRALALSPYLKLYIDDVATRPKHLQPKCGSFQTIVQGFEDNLLPAKLAFFESVANDIEPFLKDFQSDAPLAPFLNSAISEILRNVMGRIVLKDVINANVQNIDLEKNENLIPIKDLHLGYGVRKALKYCKNIKAKEMLIFKTECRNCIIFFINKIRERSPLKYKLTKALTCLNPETLKSNMKDTQNLQNALDILVSSNLMAPTVADQVLRDYSSLIQTEDVKDRIMKFSRNEIQLDHFWMEVVDVKQYSNFTHFVQLLLILSHGNACLERGFSINKECLVENLKEQSLIAQRHIFDAVTYMGGVGNVEVTKPLIHAVRNASTRYKEALEEERKKNQEELKKQKNKKEKEKEIQNLERRKRDLVQDIEKLDSEIKKKKSDL